MNVFRATAFALVLASFSHLCPAATAQLAGIEGTSADWKTGQSQQEARKIEDRRYNDVIAGLDKTHRDIYADYETDRIACGNDDRTNASCLKAAAAKRDRRLAENDQLRAQVKAFHANQIEDIYRYWETAAAQNQSNGDTIASRGGGNPCPEPMSQQATLDGAGPDWKTGKSQQEAREIEDRRNNEVIAGLDKSRRNIYADYATDRIACGNDSRTNASCLTSAADKRDRRLAQNDELRTQANAFHANQIQDIYGFRETAGAPNRSNGDNIASRGGGTPCNGDIISSRGGGNPGETPAGEDRGGNPGGGRANPDENRGGGNPSGNPGMPVSDRPQPPLDGNAQAECRQIPDSVWPPLAAFQKSVAEAAAGYDVTRRPDVGLRIMQDSLMGLGFGWLVKAASPVVTAAATRAAARLPFPVWRWGAARVGGVVPLMSSKLPPGMSLPAVLKSTPRPIYLQERETSCGLACVKMMVETVKRTSLPESWYRSLARGAYGPLDPCAYTPGQGTAMPRLTDLLRKAGITNSLKSGQQIGDLFAATRDGYPALVAVGDAKAGHAVIVDGFAQDAAGKWFVLARDPWNLNLLDAKARWSFQQMGFQNYAVYSLSDFTGTGGWNGLAIYTAP